jgi:hypothetical protein
MEEALQMGKTSATGRTRTRSKDVWKFVRRNIQRASKRGLHSAIQEYVQRIVIKRSLKMRLPESFHLENKLKVLVISCYMPDRPNLIEGLVKSVEETKSIEIDFVVTNNTTVSSRPIVKPYVKYIMPGISKYQAVARIVKDQFKPHHNYVIIVDDDVKLPSDFFDNYLRTVRGLGLILSQPALTKDSYGTFLCNRQINGAIAHLSSFVETGPVTCFERRLAKIISYEEGSPMGWGLDFAWARICIRRRWPMGVIDHTPVQHNLRGVAEKYNTKRESLLMQKYLSKTPHVPFCATQVIGQIIFEKDCPTYNLYSAHILFQRLIDRVPLTYGHVSTSARPLNKPRKDEFNG